MADNEILPARGHRADPPSNEDWCYMIVTPDPRISTGATNAGPTVQTWFVKFGDGDPTLREEPNGRYSTHNPSFFLNINKTKRAGKDLEKPIFSQRKFSRAGQSKEWYLVYENGVPPLRSDLETFVTGFPSLNLQDQTQVDTFITTVTTAIPLSCAKP